MRAILGLDHVQVAAPIGCEEPARAFYGGLLGLEELERPAALGGAGGLWFALGAQELHVGVLPADLLVPGRKAHPGFLVDPGELDVLAGRLERANHPVTWDERLDDRRRFYVDDPFGNRLELLAR